MSKLPPLPSEEDQKKWEEHLRLLYSPQEIASWADDCKHKWTFVVVPNPNQWFGFLVMLFGICVMVSGVVWAVLAVYLAFTAADGGIGWAALLCLIPIFVGGIFYNCGQFMWVDRYSHWECTRCRIRGISGFCPIHGWSAARCWCEANLRE